MDEITYTCRGSVIDVPSEDGSGKSLKAFKGCGQALNEIIESYPFDGVLYEYECPSCKAKHKVRRTPKE